MKKSRGYKVFTVFNYIFMAIVLFCCIYPFLYMIAISLSDTKAVVAGQVKLFPVGFNLKAYQSILEYPNFFRSYLNTIFYTVFGSAIALFMTICFAYPLSKPQLKGRSVLMKMVIFSMFFTGGIIPNFLLINWLNIADTIWAILLPFAIGPFNLIILINFFKSLPSSIEEAAIIDGMGYFGILYKIIIPLSKPAIATVLLYIAIFFWNDWFYGMIYLNNNERFPVMLILRNIVTGGSIAGAAAGGGGDESNVVYSTLKSAASILTTLPIIALYPLLQRFFISGLTVGSVKE